MLLADHLLVKQPRSSSRLHDGLAQQESLSFPPSFGCLDLMGLWMQVMHLSVKKRAAFFTPSNVPANKPPNDQDDSAVSGDSRDHITWCSPSSCHLRHCKALLAGSALSPKGL